ncbi:La RNA-binding domain-containing protein Ecym_3051 [Eremothecium cymbalariae DBVPG|uniref:HTH La-type RNA-binding domain-containing protein n=1 Tax=Eremothecium cymbalariae (strain CBS 270.75 / DBVPG 7215 / KCTC 17166 / NRRL Y-17582) TaxID=931890 RepID=G8JQZ4_ERECY|nr:Hypothetical protein Ecym_3051 [Eremothecium cymbalariae DBVPG\
MVASCTMSATSIGSSYQIRTKEYLTYESSSKDRLKSTMEFVDSYYPGSSLQVVPANKKHSGSISATATDYLLDSPSLQGSLEYHESSQSTLATPINSSPLPPTSKGLAAQPSLYPYLSPMTVVAPQEGEPITTTIGPFTVSIPPPENSGVFHPSMSPVNCLITPIGENKIISYYEVSPMARIIKQIEDVNKQLLYYFSEENLPRDSFLREKMDTYGYVEIETFLQFPRVVSMTREIPNRAQKLRVLYNAFKYSDPEIFELKNDTEVRIRGTWKRWVCKIA